MYNTQECFFKLWKGQEENTLGPVHFPVKISLFCTNVYAISVQDAFRTEDVSRIVIPLSSCRKSASVI